MMTPAVMQQLATKPTALPPSPVRPAGEPLSTIRQTDLRTQRAPAADAPAAAAPETPWSAPLSGETAVTAQRLGQQTAAEEEPPADDAAPRSMPGELSPEQQARVAELKARDAEVRTHEQAHKAVGGRYAGAPRYETTRGPDGNTYAIGGEVAIDVSPAGTPDETIDKMIQVKAAALAPAEPSPQDRRVAAMADALRLQAMAEARAQGAAESDAAFAESQGDGEEMAPFALGGGAGADVVPLAYRKPPIPILLHGMAAYGATLAMNAPSPYAQRAERFDLVA
ncbi:putative metalloprotease CJM1_0395 family protein [Caenispirillum bisanense]|uniref:SprA-related family protein n=1 Tax=Caenispirillum bisanense TaxID=414052 RepID=A0A286H2L7_9PROT|nr:putative metalloprotease CJM1_0395 family protein [Caenispirillum bisanense]SOE01696.1 SprA-related family protein [Caenispirillum bisanense]